MTSERILVITLLGKNSEIIQIPSRSLRYKRSLFFYSYINIYTIFDQIEIINYCMHFDDFL